MDLSAIRTQIDGLDRRIVDLLNERLALAAEIGKLKRSQGGQIYVAEREDAVLRKVCELNGGPIKDDALKAIYREIMSAAIALESDGLDPKDGWRLDIARAVFVKVAS